MPAISLPIVASESQSDSTSFSPVSPGSSFASFLAGTGISPVKSGRSAGQQNSPMDPLAIKGNLSITGNLLNAANLSTNANQPVIANQNLPAQNAESTKTGAAHPGLVNIDAPAAEINKTDTVNPDLAKIEISTAVSMKTDRSASGLPGKIAATPAPPRKKENTESPAVALAVTALAPAQWTPTVPPQPPMGDVPKSAGAPATNDANAPAVLFRPQIAPLASSDLTAFAQEAGTQMQPPISTSQFEAIPTIKTVLAPPRLNRYAQIGSKEQPRLPSGSDMIPQTPAAPPAPQDVPLALPLAEPAKSLETISVSQAANIFANVDTQTDLQSSLPDFPAQPATDSPLPAVNPEPHPTNSPATGFVLPQTQVLTQVGLPASVSTDKATVIGRVGASESESGTNSVPAMQVAPASNETKPETVARAVVNFNSPIQMPDLRSVMTPSPKAPIQPSIPAQNSNTQASFGPHTEISDSKVSRSLPTSSSLKTGNIKTESTGPMQSANQDPRPENFSAANTSASKADTIKTNAPARAAAKDSSAPQNSGPDPKTPSAPPLAATTVAATQANSQLGPATNGGTSIAGVQSAANSPVRTDGAAPQVKTGAALDTTPGPEPPQAQVARIFHNSSQSEMHVGFRTESFGAVDVHTTISEKQVEVAMSSERGDLKGFMASEMPALQSNLQQHDLRLQTLRTIVPAYVTQSDVFSGAGGQPQDSQRQGTVWRTAVFQGHETVQGEDEDLWAPRAGLSVRV